MALPVPDTVFRGDASLAYLTWLRCANVLCTIIRDVAKGRARGPWSFPPDTKIGNILDASEAGVKHVAMIRATYLPYPVLNQAQ